MLMIHRRNMYRILIQIYKQLETSIEREKRSDARSFGEFHGSLFVLHVDAQIAVAGCYANDRNSQINSRSLDFLPFLPRSSTPPLRGTQDCIFTVRF